MENNNRSRPRGRAPHLHLETPGHQSLNSFPASHSHRQTPTHTAQDTFNSGMMSGTARGTSRFSPQMLSPGQNEIDGYHNNSRWSSQSGYLPENALEHQVGLWLSSQESSTYPNNSALMTGSHRSGSQMLPYSPESLQPFEHLGGFSWVPSDPGAQVPLQSPEEPRSAMMAPPQNHLLPDMTRYENPHLQQYTGSSLLCTPPGSSSARYVPYPYTPRTNDSEIMPARTNKSQSIASPLEETLHGQKLFICEWKLCNKVFPRHDTFKRHVMEQHVAPDANPCPIPGCDRAFARKERLEGHKKHAHPR